MISLPGVTLCWTLIPDQRHWYLLFHMKRRGGDTILWLTSLHWLPTVSRLQCHGQSRSLQPLHVGALTDMSWYHSISSGSHLSTSSLNINTTPGLGWATVLWTIIIRISSTTGHRCWPAWLLAPVVTHFLAGPTFIYTLRWVLLALQTSNCPLYLRSTVTKF